MPRDSAFSRAGTQAQSASFDSMHSSTPIPNGKSVFYECVRFTWTKNRHFGQAIQFANRIVSDKIHYRVTNTDDVQVVAKELVIINSERMLQLRRLGYACIRCWRRLLRMLSQQGGHRQS